MKQNYKLNNSEKSVYKGEQLNMRMIILLLFICILLPVTVSSQNTSDYYPLRVGNVWEYTMVGSDTMRREVITYLSNYNAYVVEQISKFSDFPPITVQTLVEIRKNKVLSLGTRGGLYGNEWNMSSCPDIILQFPLKVGDSYKKACSKGTKNEVIKECNVLNSEQFKIKAGIFDNVYMIKCTIHFPNDSTLDEFGGGTSYDYYAPNIGLIKTEMENDGKRITFIELSKFKKQ